jgi:hypothetical protein
MGLASVIVVGPTVCVFTEVCDVFVEQVVRAEHNHYAVALQYRPECWPRLLGTPTPKCDDVYGSGQEHAPEGTWLGRNHWPLHAVMHTLPAVGLRTNYDARLVENQGMRLPDGSSWQWHRDVDFLEIQPQGVSPKLHSSGLWLWVGHPAFGDALALLSYLGFLALAGVVSFHSLKRLWGFDILDEPRGHDLEERCIKESKAVVWFAPLGFEEKLKEASYYDASVDAGEHERAYLVLEPNALPRELIYERLHETTSKSFVVLSSGDPLRAAPADLREKWLDALREFTKLEAPGRAAPSTTQERPFQLELEWVRCDDDEQRILAQLALDGCANPHPANADTIRHLRARGLLSPDTLMVDARFGDFIRSRVSDAQRRGWQQEEGSLWDDLKAPMSTVVLVLLAFAGLSGPEIRSVGTLVGPLIPAVAGGLPALVRAITSLADMWRSRK